MTRFEFFDWAVLLAYLAASVAIGSAFYRRRTDAHSYLLAGRTMSWFPIAISIIAADLSAVSYMGIPALVYKHDLKYILSAVLLPLQMALVAVVFVPVLYRLNVFTVYEYLERRFHPIARVLASVLFMAGRGAWVATMTYATAVVLAEITGMSTATAIVICGATTTFYTLLGGLEGVIWTDFLQFFVLVGGALTIAVYVLIGFEGDVGAIWRVAADGGHTTMVDFSLDPTRPYTFWGLVVGLLVYQVSTYGADQLNVQRYFATKNLRQTVMATMGSSLLLLPVLLLLYSLGIGFSAYYATHPELQATLTNPDRVMPHFTVNVLPAGLRGLVIAAIFAATMSSMASGINALTTSAVKDLIERAFAGAKRHEMFWARAVTGLWGLAATLGALLMIEAKLTILERFNALYTFFAGPLVGMFLLGLLTKRAVAGPVIAGVLLGFGTTAAVASNTDVHWLWYAPLGCLVALVVGYGGSLIGPWRYRTPAPAADGTAPQTAGVWSTARATATLVIATIAAGGWVCASGMEGQMTTRVAWTRGPDLPEPRGGYYAAWHDRGLLIAGGTFWRDARKVWSDRVDVYDAGTGAWQEGPRLPVPLGYGVMASVDGRAYLIGGMAGSAPSNRVYRLDDRAWVPVGEAPAAMVYAAVAVVGRTIYVFGGSASNDDLATVTGHVWAYDPAANQWKRLPDMPGPPRLLQGAAVLDSCVYLFGGLTQVRGEPFRNLDVAHRFDTAAGTWHPLRGMPAALRAHGAVTLDGSLYLMGGAAARAVSTVTRYDPLRDAYAPAGELPAAVLDMKFFAVGDRIYGAGGEDRPMSRFPGLLIGRAPSEAGDVPHRRNEDHPAEHPAQEP